MKNTLTYIVNIVLIVAICLLAMAPLESPVTHKGVRWMADLEDGAGCVFHKLHVSFVIKQPTFQNVMFCFIVFLTDCRHLLFL